MRMLVVAIALLCGCADLAGRGYRVEPPPPARGIPGVTVLGAWESNFGDIMIEADESRGGLAMGSVSGTWTYVDPTTNRPVRGLFHGTLRGSVLRLLWEEGTSSGHGFLEFAADGDSYVGQWWNRPRTKTGTWRGWRAMQGDA